MTPPGTAAAWSSGMTLMLFWFFRLVCGIWWVSSGYVDSLKLLAVDFLSVRQHYKIVPPCVLQRQGFVN